MSHTDNIIEYENLQKLNLKFEMDFQIKFKQFLEKGWYILGNEEKEFEKNFADYCGAKFCIGVANGLDALELGLNVLDFPARSEIIVPSNTYIATILAIINSGHIPVLVEPDIRTYNIDPALIEGYITPKTKAIMVVHLYGQPARMKEICRIAEKYHLEIIEDCAQAHGASIGSQIVGTFGRIGAYSFYPTKNLGALGDGGAIITSDETIFNKVQALRNYGSEKKYYNKYIGRNSRLDELQAAFLNVKLSSLNKIIDHKRKLAGIYHDLLTDSVIKPVEVRDHKHVFHIYNIRADDRDGLRSYLLKEGIHTEIHYPVSPNKQEGFLDYFTHGSYPISEVIHSTTISLPVSYSTTESEAERVAGRINKYYN